MTDALPKGLVTNSEAITGDIESIDYVAIEDIAQLWKVYTTNKAVFDGLVGSRLEYFFWRIWSSPRIHRRIKGSTVAREFLRISEGPSIIRTTPTQSPTLAGRVPSVRSKISPPHEPFRAVPSTDSRSTQGHISDVDLAPPSESQSQTTQGTGATDGRKQSEDLSEGDGTPASTRKDQRSVTFLPPILKKPRAGSQNQLPKTARVISPAFDGSNDEQFGSDESPSTSNLAVEPPTATSGAAADSSPRAGSAASLTHAAPPLISPSPRAEKEPLSRLSKKRTAFVANTASNRRRPNAVVRRKSSQSSSSGASKVTSPRLAALAQERSIPESSVLELPRSSLPESPGVALSPLSRTLILATAHTAETQLDRASSASTVAGERSHQDWLVNRDFRSRFVDRRRHENLTANVTRPVAKASAAAAAPASFQATGTLDVGERPSAKGKGKSKAEVVPLRQEGSGGPPATENEDLIPTASPRRSKSQLSDLLNRDRRLSEGTGGKRGQQREKHRKSSS